MDELPVNIDFLINNPEVTKDADRVKNDIKGVGATAEQAAAKVAANVNTIANAQIGIVGRLQNKLKDFQDKAATATTVTGIEKANAQIQLFEREIARLRVIGKQGFDDMGNRIKDAVEKPVGAINRAEAALKLYQKYARETFNPELLAKYNAKIEATKATIDQLNNAGKKGFTELGKKIEENTGKAGGFLSGLKNIAGALGLAFGISQVVAWGKELFNVAVQASGIDRAFSRIGDKNSLAKLREETRGFVSDLDLEKLTVKAKNFNIPIDKLGGFLAFAAQRAKDTGEDVEKLTENIIDGLGRKSARIIDNLGISIVEIQKEFAKTGDFTIAVSNLIQRETETAGSSVDTLADRTNRMSSAWSNALKSVSNFFTRIFNPDLADDEVIGRITRVQSKVLGLERKNQTDISEFQKRSAEQRSAVIAAQEKEVAKRDEKFRAAQALKARANDSFVGSASRAAAADRILKKEGEQLAISQNVLKSLKEQNIQAEKLERTKSNMLSLSEMEEKVTTLKTKADNIIVGVNGTEKERQALIKEAKKTQDAIDKIRGRYDKKNATADDTALRQKIALQQKITDINAEYARKSMTQDEAEIQAVRDKFVKIAKEVELFNKNPKNKFKVDGSSLDKTRDAAIADLEARQQLERDKITFDAKSQLFREYEDYKTEYGQAEADRRYTGQIGKEKTYVEYLKSLLPDVSNTTSYANYLRDYLAKEIPKAQADAFRQSFIDNIKNLKSVEEATKNSASERAEIERQYYKDLETLDNNRDKYTDEEFALRVQKLAENKAQQLLQVKDLAFKETAYYREAVMDVTNLSLEELKRRIREAKKELDNADLTPEKRAAVNEKINNAQAGLSALGFTQDQYGQDIKAYTAIGERAEKIAAYSQAVQSSFNELGNAISPFNEGLGDTLNTIGDIAGVAGNAAKSVASFASGDIVGGIQGAISAIAGIFSIGARSRESARKAQAEIAAYQDSLIKGEISYNQLLRERERTLKSIAELSLKELATRQQLLDTQKNQAQADFNRLLALIRSSGQEITNTRTEKYGGFLGIGRKTRTVQDTAGLAGSSFEQLEELYTRGKLTDATKVWFEELKKVKEELDSIGGSTDELFAQINQVATATTAQSIADAIITGFREGKRTIQDFADDFKGLMQEAALSVFKSNFLNARINDFYNEFAKASAGGLTADKIDALRASYAKIIGDAANELNDLQKVTGIDFSNSKPTSANTNSLSGAVRGITADQADLLAGQFGGFRLAQLEGNQIARSNALSISEQNSTMKSQLLVQIKIEENTKLTADVIQSVDISLKSIDKKIVNTGSILAANGKGG